MTTAANLPPGAVAANGTTDPFTNSPSHAHPAPLRYSAFDGDDFTAYSTNSPSSARRALEAHLKDTDRRIQDASRLGTTLVQQRKDLQSRLKDVEQIQSENEVPVELREKLVELEREYNEVGRESARAFLPKSRVASNDTLEPPANSSILSGHAISSPSKVSAPSRRARNQPTNRIHDIEFATEISTSLLAQVRQLQAALAEKDTAMRDTVAAKAQIETETMVLVQRIRHMDESEQKYKDENWNLEMRLQELESSHKETSDREARLAQSLKSIQVEKAAKERELDDLRLTHDRTLDDHAMSRKVQDADLHGLRRDIAYHETEKQKLHGRIEELTSQNTELAKAVGSRWNPATKESDTDFMSAEEGLNSDDGLNGHSDPPSPIKGTPARHGMLESETLKSSLNHAHRMIQNLKNNIHREKTEKIELKRMLQDARDELETRRDTGVGSVNLAKRRKEQEAIKFKKPQVPAGRLGANRDSTTEILADEPEWEDSESERTPSKSHAAAAAAVAGAVGALGLERAYSTSTDTDTDAFETADERNTTTESEAFATGAEDFDQDTEGELTETEDGPARSSTVRVASGISTVRGDRRSFLSTASTSGDDDDEIIRTPVQNTQQPKYRVRLNRASKRNSRVSDVATDLPLGDSPSSSLDTPQTARGRQSLGDELDALDDESVEGTPVRARTLDEEMLDDEQDFDDEPTTSLKRSVMTVKHTPDAVGGSFGGELPSLQIDRQFDDEGDNSVLFSPTDSTILAPVSAPVRHAMVDAGVMTEPWAPQAEEKNDAGLLSSAGGLVGGAIAGLGLGTVFGIANDETKEDSVDESSAGSNTVHDVQAEPTAIEQSEESAKDTPAKEAHIALKPQIVFAFSTIMTQEVEPQAAPLAPTSPFYFGRSSENETSAAKSAVSPVDDILATDSISTKAPSRPTTAVPRNAEADVVEVPPVPSLHEAQLSSTAGARDIPTVVIGQGLNVEQLPTADSAPTVRKPVVDEGSQTVISSDQIDSLLRSKNIVTVAAPVQDATVAPLTPPKPAQTSFVVPTSAANLAVHTAATGQSIRRPTSAGSTRSRSSQVPLPTDHTQKIAAAAQQAPASTAGSMGPPIMPASAYKRPRTPSEKLAERGPSRDGTTPRPGRSSNSRGQVNANAASSPGISHRNSVSSFASELDDRFNISRGHISYPTDVEPATDPRMIQAITQTMVGEWLWKYTRKTGRSETSNTRHRRFFWVHPYTRTLYWSENDPSTAGKNMLKAKSVAIDAVRVVTDDNVFPPGLHRKSLVVVTPGRDIVFTAPSGQRHETWFNALSYLLLKTEQEKEDAEEAANEEDIDDQRPGFGRSVRRSLSRMAARSLSRHSQGRTSLSSYNSRTTRNTSPQRTEAMRQPGQKVRNANGLTAANTSTSSSRREGREGASSSMSGRISSLAGRLRPHSRGRASADRTVSANDPAQIYDASVVAESAEDIRAQLEQQERNADMLENVRACCDGKHDVGSLSHKNRASFGNRFAGHSHSHPPSDTTRSRT